MRLFFEKTLNSSNSYVGQKFLNNSQSFILCKFNDILIYFLWETNWNTVVVVLKLFERRIEEFP